LRVVLTGASGKLGRELVPRLLASGADILAPTRRTDLVIPGVRTIHHPGLLPDADWAGLLAGADLLIHAAADGAGQGAHDQAAAERALAVNGEGTLALARAAATAGVARIIHVSTIKVLGEGAARAYREDDPFAPGDAYAQGKVAAEQAMASSLDPARLTILRPPLVHGPGAKGNFGALVSLVDLGLPLPFAAIDNQRSLCGVGTLSWAVTELARRPGPQPPVLNIADDKDFSTPGLIRLIARLKGRKARLFPLPPAVITASLKVAGRGAWVEKLMGSLTLNRARMLETLGAPPQTAEETLARTLAETA